jgi:hypothetical protein
MKSRPCGRRPPVHLTAVAAIAVAALPLAAHPAHARPGQWKGTAPPKGSRVEFSYSAPRADGDRTRWRWTIRNNGDRPADQVVLTHELTPKIKVASISAPCLIVQGGAIECDYGTLRPGERRVGTLIAAVPPNLQGRVQIKGYATWRQAPGPTTPATAQAHSQPGTPKGTALQPDRDDSPEPRPRPSTPERDRAGTH